MGTPLKQAGGKYRVRMKLKLLNSPQILQIGHLASRFTMNECFSQLTSFPRAEILVVSFLSQAPVSDSVNIRRDDICKDTHTKLHICTLQDDMCTPVRIHQLWCLSSEAKKDFSLVISFHHVTIVPYIRLSWEQKITRSVLFSLSVSY